MRTTLAQAKAHTGIQRISGMCATDSRLVDLINEAQQRLLTRGKWWGTYQKYQICVSDGCITWPRQIAAIEAVAVSDQPVKIRNEWHEFLENGNGLQNGDSGGLTLYDRGTVCAFDDIDNNVTKIKVYADVEEDGDAEILLLGYDENGNWIRTQVDGVWVDGEWVSINAATPATSTKFFASLTGVQKPITNGPVRLYAYNTEEDSQSAIAYYEPDETTPSYRRSVISDLANQGSNGACETKAVTVMAKMEFIPARRDTDYLLIGNLPAIKDMIQSIKKSEADLFQEALAWEQKAINELEKELSHYLGDGAVVQMKTENKAIFGGGVENMI